MRSSANNTTAGLSLVLALMILPQLLCSCDYARMKDDEAIQTQDASMPQMPKNIISVEDSCDRLRGADALNLENPLAYNTETIERGRERYGFYCAQCHGVSGRGNGTVGQSFAPLPADLQSSQVQRQKDGELFYRTSFGYKRHPPMAYTVAELDRWAIVIYIRSLVDQTKG
ncbi:MAG: c-type cytochrome [Desulforhabdus sp.]|jgi:mono/diheme cytochrome c family protein|nr:c-type cytochrome [Desulforhabdus sp.]